MLGISAGAVQKTINDFRSAIDYIQYFFTGIKGWICRSQINSVYQQKLYQLDKLLDTKFDEDNVYISLNTFYRNERTVECLKRLNALYVDIDCYKCGMDKQSILEWLEQDYYEKIIPHPTFVIDSGRGLYLVWKLQDEDRNALPRWKKVQKYLTDKLLIFGADPVCKDAARILRVPFSINSKSDTRVEIIKFCDVTYKIRDIELEYNLTFPKNKYKRADGKKTHPYNTATESMRQYAMDIALKLGIALPDLNNYKETQEWIASNTISNNDNIFNTEKIYHILKGYCNDIKTLFSLRRGEDCKREIALFLYRLFVFDITKDKKLALEKTLELNSSFDCPFSEKYVIKTTKSAERKIDKGENYNYKRETIIQILEITTEEMKNLVYLVDADRRKERKKEQNKKYYQERLTQQGKNTKKESMAKRRDVFIDMQKNGKSAGEIMRELGISRATYYRMRSEVTAEFASIKKNIAKTVRETIEKVKNVMREVVKKNEDSKVSQKLSLIIIKALRSNAVPFFLSISGGVVNSS